jgi:hypothetical protein
MTQAESNIEAAINTANLSEWNQAEAGPPIPPSNQVQYNVSSQPVLFGTGDIQFVANPLDATEFFLQLSDGRSGNTALEQYFLPLLYTGFNYVIPQSVRNFTTQQTAEVLGQPATRIGAAPLPSSQLDSRALNFIGFGTFPLAISNLQFAPYASSTSTATSFTIDLISSASSASGVGHVKGCLVNDSASGSNGNYYGSAQGMGAINQLEGLLNYFGSTTIEPTVAPAVVENGSPLSAFDPANKTFQARENEIAAALQQLVAKRNYIIPVLATDPVFAGTNQVVGFAYLQISNINFATSPPTVTVNIQASVPVRNASSATGFSSIPTMLGQQMPPSQGPFLPRQWDANSNGVSARPHGVVLAPALSPRPPVARVGAAT